MSALSLQRREAINSRSKHSLESNHEKGTKTSYTDGFVPLYTSKKSYYAFSQTDFYHKTNPNLFFRKGSDQKFLVEHRRLELAQGYPKMSHSVLSGRTMLPHLTNSSHSIPRDTTRLMVQIMVLIQAKEVRLPLIKIDCITIHFGGRTQ